MALTPGTKLGPYEIVAPLGSGGMGEVYRARDTRLGRDVAVKVLPHHLSSSPGFRARFELEARAVSALSHPNICVLHDIGREGDTEFLVMELVAGKTLADVLRAGGLPLPRLLDIAVAIADALSAAHEAGITHRDLKPANIMVSEQGRVKVLDFGLARMEAGGAPEGETQLATRPVTEEGSVLGTAPYMSPEQAKGKPLDNRTDIFSFGTILYEMATGRRPFEGDSSLELASAILRDTPPPVSDVNPAMPRHLGRIIRHCLEKERRDRFQTALDLKFELVELRKDVESGEHSPGSAFPGAPASTSAGSPAVPSSSGPAARMSDPSAPPRPASETPPTPKAARPRWLAPAAVALVAAVLAAAGVALLSGRRGAEPPSPPAATPATGSASAPKRRMIVVLPFENLGAAEDAYFAAGMTDEFTSRLARVSGLGVISRTSAVQYDRTGKTMRQIGEDLGVDFVLEGTVRWERGGGGGAKASRVRVTPQLIRVADDTNVWSDTYDRHIDDLFSVQSEIATNVVKSLGVTLLESERGALEARPTQNLEAYQAFVRGKEHDQGNSGEEIRMSIRMFERAVELDSTFAVAWAALSRAYSKIYHFGLDRSEAQIAQARAAKDRAFALAPGLPEAEIAEGYYHYWIFRDYPAALAAFARAEKSLPNDSEVLQAIAFTWRRQGRFEEAIEKMKMAFELSPNDASIPQYLGESYGFLHRYDEAIAYVNRALALKPDMLAAYISKSQILVCQGDLATARRTLEATPDDADGRVTLTLLRLDLAERKLDGARDRLAAFRGDVFEDQWVFLPKSLLEGVVAGLAGDSASARASLQAARGRLESELALRPDDHRVHSALGVVLARLGEKEAAIREGKRGVELFPVSKDAMIGPDRLVDLAGIYAMTGETAAALDLLERVSSIPSGPWFTLRLDPRWDSLRDNARFQRLLDKKPS